MLSKKHFNITKPYFPLPRGYAPHKTLSNRFVRWSRIGVLNRIFAELVVKVGTPDRLMIDATHLKAHRSQPTKKWMFPTVSAGRKAA